VQIDGTLRLILGYIVALDTGKVVYSRNVQVDERPLVEGGHTPLGGVGPTASKRMTMMTVRSSSSSSSSSRRRRMTMITVRSSSSSSRRRRRRSSSSLRGQGHRDQRGECHGQPS
jgi:hypothetical protein